MSTGFNSTNKRRLLTTLTTQVSDRACSRYDSRYISTGHGPKAERSASAKWLWRFGVGYKNSAMEKKRTTTRTTQTSMYLLLFLFALPPLLRVDSFSLRCCSASFGHHFSKPPDPRSSASSVSSLRFSAVAQTPVVENTAQQVATKPLGLITFDLDDSLYAIQPVLEDANQVFVEKMGHYGYEITQAEINEAGKRYVEVMFPRCTNSPNILFVCIVRRLTG